MIDLIIRLLLEILLAKHESKRQAVNEAIITLKELKGELDEEYLDHEKYGSYKEE